MLNRTVFSDYHCCTIVVTDTATTVAELLSTALALLGKSLPDDGQVVQIALTPVSDITVQDSDWGSAITVSGGGSWQFPVTTAMDLLELACAVGTVNCALELLFVPKLA